MNYSVYQQLADLTGQIQLGAAIILVVVFALFSWTILRKLLGLDVDSLVNKRLSGLSKIQTTQQSKEAQTKQQLEMMTDPVIKYLLPRIKIKNSWEKNRDLKLLGWDKYFTAERFTALNILLKVIGVILIICVALIEPVMAIFWGFPFLFLMDILYHSQVSEKRDRLLMEFPDFIEVLEGYLGAGYDFIRATEYAIPITDHWQPILKEFVAIAQYENLESGFKYIHDMVEIFEVREFLSVLQLGIDQGLDMEENIRLQSRRIEELQGVAFAKKIASREVMAVLVQGPLLITVLAAFSLPTIEQMMNL